MGVLIEVGKVAHHRPDSPLLLVHDPAQQQVSA
jgi:hypothetical protein